MRPKRPRFPQYTHVFGVPWQMCPPSVPVPDAVWHVTACQLKGKRTHRIWVAATTILATDPLSVLCRLPEDTHELAISWVPGSADQVWPARWERVHLVDKESCEDRSCGLWWIGSPCLDFVESGRLFQV